MLFVRWGFLMFSFGSLFRCHWKITREISDNFCHTSVSSHFFSLILFVLLLMKSPQKALDFLRRSRSLLKLKNQNNSFVALRKQNKKCTYDKLQDINYVFSLNILFSFVVPLMLSTQASVCLMNKAEIYEENFMLHYIFLD